MMGHSKTWSIVGDGRLTERRFCGIWFYQRTTTQKWSPRMHEYERERGIRIGHRRFGCTETVCKFMDGLQPVTRKGAF